MPPLALSDAVGAPVGVVVVLGAEGSLPSGALEVADGGEVPVLVGVFVVEGVELGPSVLLPLLAVILALPVALLVPSGSFVLSASLLLVHAATISANKGSAPR